MFKCAKIDYLSFGYITYYKNVRVYKQSKKYQNICYQGFDTLLTKLTVE